VLTNPVVRNYLDIIGLVTMLIVWVRHRKFNMSQNILDVPSPVITDLGSSFSQSTDENSQDTISGADPVTSAELNVMLSHLEI
jgi:hypothetical protein